MHMNAFKCRRPTLSWPMFSLVLLSLALWPTVAKCMTDDTISGLRQDTKDLFYHGYDNYMAHAFPEDELRPISCKPQTRNRDNPADIGLNDVLGNYSLTLIDSLSTLAILASAQDDDRRDKRQPLRDFQDGVKSLVELYGDGTNSTRCGTRACGFDLDSKVQVFETNIRGVGGLLSAHLFAIGELPIHGYDPVWKEGKNPGIRWRNGLIYHGQLLNLAHDLASRLLPAFSTSTDIPYPRVNLRTGIPFYLDTEGFCRVDGSSSEPREITENCAAGAGSLVLEFSTLSRLTGDMRFENLGKRAFWAIWNRRSALGLIGNGIDAENGQWTLPPLSGIGAGIDSFFEYSLKSHILLSNLPYDPANHLIDSSDNFLEVWEQAHSAVKRHVYRNGNQEKYPYYSQVDLVTGAPRYSWVDNLSAYYPGLLVLAGELEEAIESHLLFSALWTRYSALPERWNVPNSYIDPNFRHWAGRPEFIESTFHLYQATKDPYYLHTGEMALRDIRRRCWTRCGWADLGDVNSGEQRDRMESFFLGETAKYLYLLFSENHPLNKLDRAVVFTTEGHPLVIPAKYGSPTSTTGTSRWNRGQEQPTYSAGICAVPEPPAPFFVSNVVVRPDFFHAAALAQLHKVAVNPIRSSPLVENSPHGPAISLADIRSPTNYTFYPWTLPQDLIPTDGFSLPIASAVISTLSFPLLSSTSDPALDNGIPQLGAVHKLADGILINSLSNLRLNMVQEPKSLLLPISEGSNLFEEVVVGQEFRIHGIANWALGRDERVLLTSDALKAISPGDPHFTRVKDLEMLDLIIDVPLDLDPQPTAPPELNDDHETLDTENSTLDSIWDELEGMLTSLLGSKSAIEKVKSSVQLLRPTSTPPSGSNLRFIRHSLPAILPTGPGAAALPAVLDDDTFPAPQLGRLPLKQIFWLDDELCNHRLPAHIAKSYQVLVIRRGGCSFNEKLENIPAVSPPSIAAGDRGENVGLGLVIVVSGSQSPAGYQNGGSGFRDKGGRDHTASAPGLTRPLLEKIQRTPAGIERRYPLAMVLIEGSTPLPPISIVSGSAAKETLPAREVLLRASSAAGHFDQHSGELVESDRGTFDVTGAVGVKRRFWFESLGVVIGNLGML